MEGMSGKKKKKNRFRAWLCPLLLLCGMMNLCGCRGTNALVSGLTEETITVPASADSGQSSGSEDPEDIAAESEQQGKNDKINGDDTSADTADLTITMLDVGQGLSLLIETDGHSLIYDGGGRESSSYVVNYLQRKELTSLDYMIASHYDEDHIAGLVGCLYSFSVDTVLCPDYTADTDIYRSFEKALAASGARTLHPSQDDTYELGGAGITILGPETYESGEDNNNSIAVRIEYGDFACVITGDAEEEEEKQIVDSGINLTADLLVAGHHGSRYSTTANFLKAVSPSCVWISCGLANDYGHPAQETMERLEEYGVEIRRTDLQGDLVCSTDGSSISFSTAACQDYSDGSAAAETAAVSRGIIPAVDDTEGEESAAAGTLEESDSPEAESGASDTVSVRQEYILNTSSMKFHLPDCSAVEKMSSHNRLEVEAYREDLIAEGYEPCAICNP